MSDRDEFSEKTRLLLSKRVGTICSNPGCVASTYGPNDDPSKATSKGVAAHLTAAAKGGPRYDPSLTDKQRKHYDNGIWLCQSCSTIIDRDKKQYTLSILRSWKEKAEDRARRALENPSLLNTGPNYAETLVLVLVQRTQPPIEPPSDLKVPAGHVIRMKASLKPVDVPNDILSPNLAFQFGPSNNLPKGQCLVTVICQNQGTGLDQNVKIDIEFDSGAIINHRLSNRERVILINGGGKGGWDASFLIPNLLPGEYRSAVIGARDEPFRVNVWSQNSSRKVAICRFDVVFGDYEFVPIENSPYRSDRAS